MKINDPRKIYVRVKFYDYYEGKMRFKDIINNKIYFLESRQVPGILVMDGPFYNDQVYKTRFIPPNKIEHP